MAINGEKFLRVSKAGFFIIKDHALERIEQFTGAPLEKEEAFDLFRQGIQLTYSDMLMRGYRPAYKPRLRAGVPSWYFDLHHQEKELIAVIAPGEYDGEYEWVTTYARNRRNESNLLWGIEKTAQAA